MQDIDSILERKPKVLSTRSSHLRRFLPFYVVLLALVVAALILPLLNVNRLQRRIVASLSESLGRPIHLDRISLTIMPLPGFTIENLVVGEDAAFGAEPFIRASRVRATLRVSSLWRRRIEFTRISFTDPSINLVRTDSGKWNIESILLQAARIEVAPTTQRRASATPRFPYIEASGARLNLKLGHEVVQGGPRTGVQVGIQEKIPISLTDADLALWLPSPQEWRLRLRGRPLRTDTGASDTGSVRMEGTLGRAAVLDDVPIDLKAEWRDVPLGEASQVILGRDAGLRGTMTVSGTARGTVRQSAVQTLLHLADLRRADFVPLHTLSVDAECQAVEASAFRSISDLRCSWPPALTPGLKTLALTGSIPDTHQLSSSTLQVGSAGIPAGTLLDWLHIASSRVSPEIAVTGSLTGSLFFRPASATASSSTIEGEGQFTLANASLSIPSVSDAAIFSGTASLRFTSPLQTLNRQLHGLIAIAPLVILPMPLMLGGRDFATLDGRLDDAGYTLHLTGTAAPAKLLALGAALPQVGDGLASVLPTEDLASPIRFDLISARPWGGAQIWHVNSRVPATTPRHVARHPLFR